jgi:glutathione S-transferase/RNA polymerase-associated protein
VPVLFVDGRALFDSTIILEFIEDRFPTPPLLPADPFERARLRTIEEVCDTHYEAITWGLSEIAYFRRAEGEEAEAMRASARQQLQRLNQWLEGQLGAGPWFGGEAFGWGDLCAAPFVQGAAGFEMGPSAGSALAEWLARARERPSAAAAFKAARDSLAAMSAAARVVEAGLFKRQYRDHRLEWMIKTGGLEIVRKGLERDNIRFNDVPN